MTAKTFRDAYGILQQHSQTLREQQEPNIDDLLSIVTESVDAYKICQQRIEAVEKALEKALSDTGTPVKEVKEVKGGPKTPSAGAGDADTESDDIPF